MSSLSRIVPTAHDYLAEVLAAGAHAIDLTAGNGHDTLFLAGCVGRAGTLLSFDVQKQALENTTQRLRDAGLEPFFHQEPADHYAPGIHLIHASHDQLQRYARLEPAAVIANLGFLPGGDRGLITRPETTVAALQQAADLLRPGGRLAVVVYVGHPGGPDEGQAVDTWFGNLDPSAWSVLRIERFNQALSPYLLVAEKISA